MGAGDEVVSTKPCLYAVVGNTLEFLGGSMKLPSEMLDHLKRREPGKAYPTAWAVESSSRSGMACVRYMGGRTDYLLPEDVAAQVRDALSGLG